MWYEFLGTPISTLIATAVGVTLAVSAVVFTTLGFLAGLLVMCLSTRKKAANLSAEERTGVQPTAPVGPVYEDVSPASKKEVELNSNKAYGLVGGH